MLYGQLDKYTDDLMKGFRHKGGCAGQKIRTIMALTAKVSVCFYVLHMFSTGYSFILTGIQKPLSHTNTHTHTLSLSL